MGGMHAWLWSALYPTYRDGIMPIVSLPTKITGRNLIWRKAVIGAIKNDPQWQNGKYEKQPYSYQAVWPFVRMLLDGVFHLENTIEASSDADKFVQNASQEALKSDANDLIYALEASNDYDPEPQLETINTHVFALDFTDDQFDPVQLGVLDRLIKRVKHGQAVIQIGTPHSYGHLTMAHPELWDQQVANFINFVSNGN